MKEYYSINEKELYNNNSNIEIIENFQIFKGPDGSNGERGYEGIRGLQGLQGERGYKGNMGDTGIRGPKGYAGSEGKNGIQGVTGVDGDRGALGFTGYRGEKGVFGTTGPKGFKGATGFVGRDGRPGFRGDQGVRGDKGKMSIQNISLKEDNTAIAGWQMHGFLKADPPPGEIISRAPMIIPDPRNGGNLNPTREMNFKPNIELECPYNGYISGLVWYNRQLNSGEYISNTDGTDRAKLTNSAHNNKTLQSGLPHIIKVDCNRVDVQFN